MELEKEIKQQAFNYLIYMQKRERGEEKKTLRTILADNYQALITKFGKLVHERFPHISYGQDV